MKTTIRYTIAIFLLGMMITACGGSSDGDNLAPTTTTSIVGSAWSLSEVNGSSTSDEKTTFVLQSFNLNSDGTYTATLYPNISQSGSWAEVSVTAYNITVNASDISLSNVSINGNTLSASVSIPAGIGGKTSQFTGTVIYTK